MAAGPKPAWTQHRLAGLTVLAQVRTGLPVLCDLSCASKECQSRAQKPLCARYPGKQFCHKCAQLCMNASCPLNHNTPAHKTQAHKYWIYGNKVDAARTPANISCNRCSDLHGTMLASLPAHRLVHHIVKYFPPPSVL